MLEGTGEFTIANAEGQVIFREMLTEPDLEAALVYEMTTPTATQAQREAYVRRRIDQFFRPSQFHSPAIAAESALPTGLENLDPTAWNDLKQRPDAIRFDYLKGKEDQQQIAWSPLIKEVIRVR
ncbi:hypothetical protein [Hymenobacter glacialis]|uniref:Uncharacterized protein n=1 Tax=Hymenobacter glacialis TaxID=1908236 RepID=A0A1G1T5E9_9BACT|nr:hypothetical protein [Hymenobacter glacialis]OGX86074.1 hypothetical protein BEN48_13600 [Hymenobacter glacialis]